jgi:hypothetical protein
MDNVLFYQRVSPSFARLCLQNFQSPRMVESFDTIVNGPDLT